MSFYFLTSSLISFLVIYNFHCIGLSPSSLNLFLSILVFWSYCKWYFLISFSNCSLFMYRNATDSHALDLCPATFLNMFMRYKSCLILLSFWIIIILMSMSFYLIVVLISIFLMICDVEQLTFFNIFGEKFIQSFASF
jgi:hypothetical protein